MSSLTSSSDSENSLSSSSTDSIASSKCVLSTRPRSSRRTLSPTRPVNQALVDILAEQKCISRCDAELMLAEGYKVRDSNSVPLKEAKVLLTPHKYDNDKTIVLEESNGNERSLRTRSRRRLMNEVEEFKTQATDRRTRQSPAQIQRTKPTNVIKLCSPNERHESALRSLVQNSENNLEEQASVPTDLNVSPQVERSKRKVVLMNLSQSLLRSPRLSLSPSSPPRIVRSPSPTKVSSVQLQSPPTSPCKSPLSPPRTSLMTAGTPISPKTPPRLVLEEPVVQPMDLTECTNNANKLTR